MTPHERAEQFLRDWRRTPGQEPMVEALATAFAAHTADLRTLLAQQAARADAAEESRKLALKRIDFENKAAFRYREQRDAALAQVTRYNEMAGKDADELATLRAENERLREALEKSRELAVAAANADVDAATSLEPGTDVFGAAGIAKKVLVVEAKRRWAHYDNCIDAALAGGDHE
jgi:hypothetical protein